MSNHTPVSTSSSVLNEYVFCAIFGVLIVEQLSKEISKKDSPSAMNRNIYKDSHFGFSFRFWPKLKLFLGFGFGIGFG